jgi:hypothetical protein
MKFGTAAGLLPRSDHAACCIVKTPSRLTSKFEPPGNCPSTGSETEIGSKLRQSNATLLLNERRLATLSVELRSRRAEVRLRNLRSSDVKQSVRELFHALDR